MKNARTVSLRLQVWKDLFYVWKEILQAWKDHFPLWNGRLQRREDLRHLWKIGHPVWKDLFQHRKNRLPLWETKQRYQDACFLLHLEYRSWILESSKIMLSRLNRVRCVLA